MKTKLLDLIDFEKVDILLEGFNKSTGFVTAILDLKGNVLSKSGWRQICTDFHRIHPETSKKCATSDTELAGKITGGEKYHYYKCLNGLVDVAVPIVVNGEHIANLFSGQFFFEKPDLLFFKNQARKFGFDEQDYLDALDKVPVVSQEKVQTAMNFLLNMTQLISETIYQKMEQTELNKTLKESAEEYRNLIEFSPVAMVIVHDWKTIYFNPAAVLLFGANSQEELLGKHIFDFVHPDYHALAIENSKILAEKGFVSMQEQKYIKLDGSILDVETQAKSIRFNNNTATLVMMSDITERKKAEKALEESERLFRKLFEESSDAILLIDETDVFVECNQAGLDLLKMTRDQFLFCSPHSISPEFQPNGETSKEAVKKVIDLAYKNGLHRFEWTHCNAEGEDFIVDISLMPIVIRGKTMLHITWRDITDRKQTEKALVKSEENLSITLHSIGDGVISTDKAGLIVKMNPIAEKLCGWYLAEAEGKHLKEVFKIINAETCEIVDDPVKKVLETGEIVGLANHTVLLSRDGSEYQIADSAAPIKNNKGEVSGVVLVFSDVSDKYAAEQAMKESEERFKALHNASFGGIVIHDKGMILECNQGLSEMTGYSYEELIGMDGLLLIASETRDLVLNNILAGYEKPYEALGQRKNGEIFPIRLEARNIPYKGKNVRTVEFRDITENKRAELELINSKLRAQESDRLKSAFLANMSHEIRTPMNGILGFAELLKKPNLSGEEQQDYIRIIEKSGTRMLNIINDIIDISKIEAGLMKLNLKESNVNEQIDYIYTFFKPEVEAKGMDISIKNSLPTKAANMITDREKLYAILTNLVKNAIKYSQEGRIEIGYNKKGNYLEFYVKDTGIGIPPDRQEAIFERFIQADIADKMAHQGAGLGLSITKAYVEMLGGTIWVESKEGVGSTFYFTLPYNASIQDESRQQAAEMANIEEIRKLKILIAEDDEVSGMLLDLNVSVYSKEIIKATSGAEAVEIARRTPDIDLILMDIRMPDMDGYEATRQIRQFNKDVIIVAQTAFGLSGDREKSLEAGCNDYIAKPIKKEELAAIVHKSFAH